MTRSLLSIKKDIMTGKHTAEEWLQYEKEVAEAMKTATKEEIDDFVDSGAGEALDMSCSAIREIAKHNHQP